MKNVEMLNITSESGFYYNLLFCCRTDVEAPDFSSLGDFKLQNSSRTRRRKVETSGDESDYLPQFKKMLIKLVDYYTKVPYYGFEIFAENFNIPELELRILIHLFQKKGVIIPDDDKMYRINLDDSYF